MTDAAMARLSPTRVAHAQPQDSPPRISITQGSPSRPTRSRLPGRSPIARRSAASVGSGESRAMVAI